MKDSIDWVIFYKILGWNFLKDSKSYKKSLIIPYKKLLYNHIKHQSDCALEFWKFSLILIVIWFTTRLPRGSPKLCSLGGFAYWGLICIPAKWLFCLYSYFIIGCITRINLFKAILFAVHSGITMKLLANTSSASKPDPQDRAGDEKKSLVEAKDKFSNKLVICGLFVCVSLISFWQMYSFSKLFVISSTNFLMETQFDANVKPLPAMTFCTNVGHIDANRTDEVFDKWRAEDILSYISVESYDTWSVEDITHHFMPYAIQSISYKYFCFTINSKQRGDHRILWPLFIFLLTYSPLWPGIRQMKLKGDQYLTLRLKKFGIYKSWWLFMHNPMDVPSSYDWNSIELKKGHYIAISYSHQAFRLNAELQNCRNFGPESDYSSRSQCIRNCKIRRSVSDCGVIFHGIDVRSDEIPLRFAKTESEKNCVININLGNVCADECRAIECNKDHYKPEIIMKSERKDDFLSLRLIPPSEPVITYSQTPFIQPKELRYLWVTTIAIWLTVVFAMIHLWLRTEHSIPVGIEQRLNAINDKVSQKNNIDSKQDIWVINDNIIDNYSSKASREPKISKSIDYLS